MYADACPDSNPVCNPSCNAFEAASSKFVTSGALVDEWTSSPEALAMHYWADNI